jgi:hypothetical protein
MKKGFTLLETVISVAAYALILTVISLSLKRAADLYTDVFSNYSAFFNVSLGMDFFEKQIRTAKKIIIPLSSGEKKLTVVSDVEHHFWLNANAPPSSNRYMRLEFGGQANRLAYFVKNVEISFDVYKKILTVAIIPDPEKNLETLTREFDVSYIEVVYN